MRRSLWVIFQYIKMTASLSSAFLSDCIQTLKKICLLFGSPSTGGETGACSVASSDIDLQSFQEYLLSNSSCHDLGSASSRPFFWEVQFMSLKNVCQDRGINFLFRWWSTEEIDSLWPLDGCKTKRISAIIFSSCFFLENFYWLRLRKLDLEVAIHNSLSPLFILDGNLILCTNLEF